MNDPLIVDDEMSKPQTLQKRLCVELLWLWTTKWKCTLTAICSIEEFGFESNV